MPSLHCFDCGAQRTYMLQPRMQKGSMEVRTTVLYFTHRGYLLIKRTQWLGTPGEARDILMQWPRMNCTRVVL